MSNRTVNASAWYAGTAVVIVLVLVGSWFGFSSAKMSSAGLIREEVESAEHRNHILNTRVQALRADYAKLDEYRAEILALGVGIPSSIQLSAFIDVAAQLADEHDVFVVDIQPVAPVDIVPTDDSPEPATAEVPAPGEGSTAESKDDASPTPDGTAAKEAGDSAAEPVIEGFAGLAIMFTVAGETPDVVAFLDKMQQHDRLFLPTIIRQERLDESAPTGGMPEIPEGWIQMDLTGYVFMFAHKLADPVDPSLGELPRKSDRNPFVPIEGREGSGTDSPNLDNVEDGDADS